MLEHYSMMGSIISEETHEAGVLFYLLFAMSWSATRAWSTGAPSLAQIVDKEDEILYYVNKCVSFAQVLYWQLARSFHRLLTVKNVRQIVSNLRRLSSFRELNVLINASAICQATVSYITADSDTMFIIVQTVFKNDHFWTTWQKEQASAQSFCSSLSTLQPVTESTIMCCMSAHTEHAPDADAAKGARWRRSATTGASAAESANSRPTSPTTILTGSGVQSYIWRRDPETGKSFSCTTPCNLDSRLFQLQGKIVVSYSIHQNYL